MVHTGKGVGGKDKSAIEKGAIHKRGDSELGLGSCHLKALQLHGHVHVPSDLQLPLEESLRGRGQG